MRIRYAGLGLFIALLLTLSACARNTILREDASALSADLASVLVQTREFYAKHAIARTDYLLRLLASDPNCEYRFPVYLIQEASPSNRIRCATDPEKETINNGGQLPSVTARLYAKPDESDYAALQFLAIVAEYQVLLARIVEDPAFDSTADLQQLAERIDELRERYGTLASTGTDNKFSLFKEEINALGALGDLIRIAIHDRMTVERLRELIGREGLKVEEALKQVESRYRQYDAPFLTSLELHAAGQRQIEFNQQLKNAKSAGERLKLLRDYASKEQSEALLTTKIDPLAKGLDGLVRSHESFRLALLEGKLTEDQRRRIARRSFANLKAWFQVIRQFSSL